MREAMQAGLDALNESRDDVTNTLNGYEYGKGFPSYDRRIAIVTEQLEKHDAAIAKMQEALAAPVEPIESEPTQTDKQAWWAGYRAGKGLPPDTPRQDAIAAPVAGMVISDAEIDEIHIKAYREWALNGSRFYRMFARAIIAKVEGK